MRHIAYNNQKAIVNTALTTWERTHNRNLNKTCKTMTTNKWHLKRHYPRRKILPKPKKMEEDSLITRFYHSRNYGTICWSVINLSLLCREARTAHAVQISWPRKSVCAAAVVQIIGVVVCSSSSSVTENKLAAIGLYARVCPCRCAGRYNNYHVILRYHAAATIVPTVLQSCSYDRQSNCFSRHPCLAISRKNICLWLWTRNLWSNRLQPTPP